jgi:copper homeostasis protein (lipoprotein)
VAKSGTPVIDRQNEQHKDIMVKKVLITLAAIGMLCALPGCNNRSDEPLKPGQEEALQPMQQSWRGVLPCADCEGIETSLYLEKDGTWVMNERYQGAKREPSSFGSYGTWARTAEKLVLTDSNGEKSYYRAKGDKLEMLDREGNPIVSTLNYTLEPVKSSLPVTPMAMRGMYFYRADAAIFTDCATGKRVPVANNAQLERDYAAARGTESKPILLMVDGHFTLQANPDTGEKMKTLVADKSTRFDAQKTCKD